MLCPNGFGCGGGVIRCAPTCLVVCMWWCAHGATWCHQGARRATCWWWCEMRCAPIGALPHRGGLHCAPMEFGTPLAGNARSPLATCWCLPWWHGGAQCVSAGHVLPGGGFLCPCAATVFARWANRVSLCPNGFRYRCRVLHFAWWHLAGSLRIGFESCSAPWDFKTALVAQGISNRVSAGQAASS